MFLSVARFELRYQLRSPVFWVAFAMFFLFAFGSIASENVTLGGGGNVHVNAPYAIVFTHLMLAVIFMFALAALVANVVVRDDETRFGPMIRTTSVSKSAYIFGRFAGAWVAAALCYASVPLALWLGTLMPWVDPATLGPNRLSTFLFAYGAMGLPVLLVTGAVLFALAVATRSMMATYIGVVIFLASYSAVNALIGSTPALRPHAPYLEPFGIAALVLETRYWTPAERNALLPPLAGPIGWSRLMWIGIAFLLLAAAQWRYRFAERGLSRRQIRREARRQARAARVEAAAPVAARPDRPLPGGDPARAWWPQLVARTGLEARMVLRSPAFLVLLLLGFVITLPQLWLGTGGMYGVASYPLTRITVQTLRQGFTLTPLIIAVYYAGELVWRERDRRFSEIVDATPLPGWAFLLPKMLAVALVLVATLAAGMLGAMAVQLLQGVGDVQLGRYLQWWLLPMGADVVLLAALAVFVQALSPNKYVGWGIMVAWFVLTTVSGQLGLDDSLYTYGATQPEPMSDMNADGGLARAAWWFRMYWAAFAVAMLAAAHLLWRRGTDARLSTRLRAFPQAARGPAGATIVAALLVFAGVGAYLWRDTHVVNPFRDRGEAERWQADYEMALLRYERVPQPAVARVRLDVRLFPAEGRALVDGTYLLRNLTDRPQGEVHVRLKGRDLELLALDIPGARVLRDWPRFNYRIYRFDRPLAPGETRPMTFRTRRWRQGIAHGGGDTRLVANGTFLNNAELAPQIGMDRDALLQDKAKRRKFGLPAELRPARLEDVAAQRRNLLGADWTLADITVTTDAGQTPIAPGKKVAERVADGRRTARFVSDAPILNFFSVQSAAYAVRTARHRGVDLAVYHHPRHAWNADRMLRAAAGALDYYGAAFGPYQFDQARVLEFPGYSSYAQSFANTVPYSEDIGFTADLRDPNEIDYVTYVTAHEIAHQYWGHQLVGADMQGGTALIETLSQYSALMVMKRLYGPDKMRRFLRYELDRYLAARRDEAVEEMPLGRVENQQYIHYQKGSLAMYLLQDRLGEAQVNRALAALLSRHRFQGAPYPRSTDLVAALRGVARSPADQALITDLFQRIVLYDLKATDPRSVRLPDGRWRTTVRVTAAKLLADGQGNERPVRFAEAIDVGAFRSEPGEGRFDRGDVLDMRRAIIRTGGQQVVLVTRAKPAFVGVDPYTLFVDRSTRDNLVAVP